MVALQEASEEILVWQARAVDGAAVAGTVGSPEVVGWVEVAGEDMEALGGTLRKSWGSWHQ